MFNSCCATLSSPNPGDYAEDGAGVSRPHAPTLPPLLRIDANNYPLAGGNNPACYCGDFCGERAPDHIVGELRKSWSTSSRQKTVPNPSLDTGDQIYLSPVLDLNSQPLVEEKTFFFATSSCGSRINAEANQQTALSPILSDTFSTSSKDFGVTVSMMSRYPSTLTFKEDPADLVNLFANDPQNILKCRPNQICLFGATRKNEQAIIEPEFEEKHLELADDVKLDRLKEELARIDVGITSKKARKPEMPNQDNVVFCRTSDFTLFGVVDGHGTAGHWVSHWVARFALHLLLMDISEQGLKCLRDLQAMMRVFNLAHEALLKRADQDLFDVQLSGTTLCICAVDHTTYEVYTSCVGDSACVLSKASGEPPEFVTTEHKPHDIEERRRIVERGGEVSDGRVWLRGKQTPGLAMSRSIGDIVAHRAGVIHQPTLNFFQLEPPAKTSRKHLFICGSDGIWDFIDPEEAVKIVSDLGPRRVEEATHALAEEARNRWLKEKNGELTDDISAIVVWL